MKKILFIAILIIPIVSNSQNVDEENIKKDNSCLYPNKGEFSIGISATPFIGFIGNIFTSSSNSAPYLSFSASNPNTIYWKYLVSDKKALRSSITLGITANSDQSPSSEPDYYNKVKQSALNIGASLGNEFYRNNKSRFRVFYGYEGGFNVIPFSGQCNALQINVIGKVDYDESNSNSNDFTETGGREYLFFFQTFSGIEFFLLPKMSLSSELGVSFNIISQEKRKHSPKNSSGFTILEPSSSINLSPYVSGIIELNYYF
ncbi:hypothetical protein ACFLTE_05295 [Bacteroidota bacterium]